MSEYMNEPRAPRPPTEWRDERDGLEPDWEAWLERRAEDKAEDWYRAHEEPRTDDQFYRGY